MNDWTDEYYPIVFSCITVDKKHTIWKTTWIQKTISNPNNQSKIKHNVTSEFHELAVYCMLIFYIVIIVTLIYINNSQHWPLLVCIFKQKTSGSYYNDLNMNKQKRPHVDDNTSWTITWHAFFTISYVAIFRKVFFWRAVEIACTIVIVSASQLMNFSHETFLAISVYICRSLLTNFLFRAVEIFKIALFYLIHSK